jgi:hypothetical protein
MALTVLGEIGPEAAGLLGAVREALADPDRDVCQEAAEALPKIERKHN